MKKWLFALLAICLCAFSANAAELSGSEGTPNSSGVHPLQVDSDRDVSIASDASLVINGAFEYNTEKALTNDTLTAIESGKTIVSAYTLDGVTYTLPTAAAGLQYTVIAGNNKTIYVDTGLTTDTIRYLTLDAGDKLSSPSSPATGDSVTVISVESGYWDIKNMGGTWQDGGS